MALISCHSRAEASLIQWLLRQRKCETSEIVGFRHDEGSNQEFAAGAWWLSTVPPVESQIALTAEVRDELEFTYYFLRAQIRQAKGKDAAAKTAAIFATRSTETIAGQENILTIRLSTTAGIDLATGRFFSEPEEDAEFDWEENFVSPELFGELPEETAEFTADENRYRMMAWLAKCFLEKDSRSMAVDEESNPVEVEAPPDAASEPQPVETIGSSGLHQTDEVLSNNDKAAPREEEVPARPRRSRLSRNAGTVNVLAMAARLGKPGHDPSNAFDSARSRILTWLGSKGFAVSDPSSNAHIELPDGELIIETNGQELWAIRFDDRRSMEDGAIWRVEATLLHSDPYPALSVRLVQVRSSEDAPPPVASGVPGVIASIAKDIGLEDAGAALHNHALRLNGPKDAAWLSDLLLNQDRSRPVILISGDINASADRLAARLVGVAHVLCVDKTVTNQLIQQFGRDRSVFGNAVRLYRPGFGPDANPYQHPVWAHKGNQLPKWLTNDVFEEACAISLEVGNLDDRAPAFQTVRKLLSDQRIADSEKRLRALREQAESLATTAEERAKQLEAIRAEQDAALVSYRDESRQLGEQIKQLQDELLATRQERDQALEEARQLRYQLSNQWVDDVTQEDDHDNKCDSYYPETWDELEEWVKIYGDGKLILHPKAAKAARESPFKDISMAYKAMEYLVRYYIPMRTRSTDDDEAYLRSKQALAELGLEESDVGTADEIKRYKKEYQRQYGSETVTLDRHLKRGVGFGGDYQFRLYFYYDPVEARVLVGHMPTHLTNRLSHNG